MVSSILKNKTVDKKITNLELNSKWFCIPKLFVDLLFKEDVSELDPMPESEVVDSIIISLSLFSPLVVSISGKI